MFVNPGDFYCQNKRATPSSFWFDAHSTRVRYLRVLAVCVLHEDHAGAHHDKPTVHAVAWYGDSPAKLRAVAVPLAKFNGTAGHGQYRQSEHNDEVAAKSWQEHHSVSYADLAALQRFFSIKGEK